MKKYFMVLVFLLFATQATAQAGPKVEIVTNMGTIKVELNLAKAPKTVKNFLSYVDKKFYDGVVFHRVIDNFMIQTGGFDKTLKRKTTNAAIKNEADNGLQNEKGTIAMARTGVVDSATSQFFINLKNNKFLNHSGKSARAYGYAVFGKVIEGMDVVVKIGKQRTMVKSQLFKNYPINQVVIEKVSRIIEE